MSYQVHSPQWRRKRSTISSGSERNRGREKTRLRNNALAHGVHFSGIARGVGKTTAARIPREKALNGVKGPTVPRLRGGVRFCKEIAAGTSLDVMRSDEASNSGHRTQLLASCASGAVRACGFAKSKVVDLGRSAHAPRERRRSVERFV